MRGGIRFLSSRNAIHKRDTKVRIMRITYTKTGKFTKKSEKEITEAAHLVVRTGRKGMTELGDETGLLNEEEQRWDANSWVMLLTPGKNFSRIFRIKNFLLSSHHKTLIKMRKKCEEFLFKKYVILFKKQCLCQAAADLVEEE